MTRQHTNEQTINNDNHKLELTNLSTGHSKQMTALTDKHLTELRVLQTKHSSEVADKDAMHKSEIETVQKEIKVSMQPLAFIILFLYTNAIIYCNLQLCYNIGNK